VYRVTDDFLRQSKQSHTFLVRFSVYDNATRLFTLEGVSSGGVNTSQNDAIRRNFDATVVITSDFTIEEADDLLQPAGTEIKPEAGFAIGAEDVYVPQGVYEIERYQASMTDDGIEVKISGYDRAFTAQKPALRPYSVRGGSNGGDALRALVQTMTPKASFIGETPWTAPSLFFPADTDRWAEAQKLANSFGSEIGYDLDGNCVLESVENAVSSQPVWRFAEGEDSCTFTAISKDVRTDHLRTGVIVIGTHSSLRSEVRGEAWDLRQNSPTYRYGPLGERPYRVYSELPLTTGQANDMALKLLSKVLAGSDMVQFECPVMPALDIGDVIDVVWPQCRINGRYMVNDVTLPFDGSLMSVQASRGSLVWGHD
jgi:hypothetical protein